MGATFSLSPDNTKILIRHNLTEKFRHSYIAQYDVFDIETNTTVQIHKGEKLQYCGWSPLRDRLAYVYLNNVFIHFSESLEISITDDGVDGVVYNGVPDWVYEEEVLSSGSAIWWSSDGSRLAVGFLTTPRWRLSPTSFTATAPPLSISIRTRSSSSIRSQAPRTPW